MLSLLKGRINLVKNGCNLLSTAEKINSWNAEVNICCQIARRKISTPWNSTEAFKTQTLEGSQSKHREARETFALRRKNPKVPSHVISVPQNSITVFQNDVVARISRSSSTGESSSADVVRHSTILLEAHQRVKPGTNNKDLISTGCSGN